MAHNLRFDRLLMDSEYLRLGRQPRWPRTFCTMLTCTDIVRAPGHRGGHKWPTLEEAHYHFFRRPPANAHDAMADIRACMAIFQELTRLGLAPRTQKERSIVGLESDYVEPRRVLHLNGPRRR